METSTYTIHKNTGETESFVGTFEAVASRTFIAHCQERYDSIVVDSSGLEVCTRGDFSRLDPRLSTLAR